MSKILSTSFPIAIVFLLLPLLTLSQTNATAENETNSCNRNCTGKPVNAICATDGNTYDNRCLMGEAACIAGREINYLEDGPCINPEPKAQECTLHRSRINENRRDPTPEWDAMCNDTLFKELSDSNQLTIDDIINCYRPECEHGAYKSRQCFRIGSRAEQKKYCWCSSESGANIADTLKVVTATDPSVDCSLRSSCFYENVEHQDGSVFRPEHQCGICECLDGVVSCFDDFVPNSEGHLNDSQLVQLSNLLKQFFYFENSQKSSVLPDIKKISALVRDIPDYVLDPIIEEWFKHYDSNGDGYIEFNHTEEVSFHVHIAQFTICKHFLDHLNEVFDTDNSGDITRAEWHDFFSRYSTTNTTESVADETEESVSGSEELPTTVERRSVSNAAQPRTLRRSLENRKKFYYVLNH